MNTNSVVQNDRAAPGTTLLATSQGNSVLTERGPLTRRSAYSAHGHRSPGSAFGRPGFNGEYLERTGVQLLGSYRGYNPVLMCFHNPDSLSPFGDGGLNAYAYCLGDPVNRVDPTGQVTEWLVPAVGIGLSVVGLGFAVAAVYTAAAHSGGLLALHLAGTTLGAAGAATGVAATIMQTDPDNQTGKILGHVSLGLGVAAFATGLSAWRYAVRSSRRSVSTMQPRPSQSLGTKSVPSATTPLPAPSATPRTSWYFDEASGLTGFDAKGQVFRPSHFRSASAPPVMQSRPPAAPPPVAPPSVAGAPPEISNPLIGGKGLLSSRGPLNAPLTSRVEEVRSSAIIY